MDLATLRLFKAVVDEGGISPAARKLHRVQSNVSTRVQQLEADLGVDLFIRDKRRLHLSPSGELFLEYAERLLATWEQARAAVQADAPRGTLRVGTLESTAASRLPALLARYHDRYPAVRVELATGTTDALLRAVTERELAAAFVADFDGGRALQSDGVFREELVAVTSRAHPAIRRARDVRADTIICFPEGCAYRRRIQAWLATDGVAPERVLELSSYHAIVACVASGTGIALVPRSVLATMRDGGGVAVHRLPARHARSQTALVWRADTPSLALEALRREVRETRR